MKLDTPLSVKGPYQLRGVIDVYRAKGRWLARSWPKKQNQPDTVAQLANRERFRLMLQARAAMHMGEFANWSGTKQKPGKSWDDFWRSNWLHGYRRYGASWLSKPSLYALPYIGYLTTHARSGATAHRIIIFWDARDPGPVDGAYQLYGLRDRRVGDFDWRQNGWLCYKGKGRYPHYVPQYPLRYEYLQGGVYIYTLQPPCPAGWRCEAYSYFPDGSHQDTSERAWQSLYVANGEAYDQVDYRLQSWLYKCPPVLLSSKGHWEDWQY